MPDRVDPSTIGELLGLLAHDLRNPLNLLMTTAQLFAELDPPPESRRRLTEAMQRAGHRMNRLIEDLLDISRILSGKLLLDIRPLQMSSVISDAVNTVSPAAHAKNIAIEVSIDPLADSVPGDANRL